MINIESAWEIIRTEAQRYLNEGLRWYSPKQKLEYRVLYVRPAMFRIGRVNGADDVTLTKSNVEKLIHLLNERGGRIYKQELNNTVAVVSTLATFHPQIRREGQDVIEVTAELAASESSNVDWNRQLVARNVREGQTALRKQLLDIYNNKCCVSNTGPVNVLQAAHIEPHAEGRNDDLSNGLLLRSDLHDLFDDNLLGINPADFVVHVHPSLKDTLYVVYDGKVLAPRPIEFPLNIAKLKNRWDSYSMGVHLKL